MVGLRLRQLLPFPCSYADVSSLARSSAGARRPRWNTQPSQALWGLQSVEVRLGPPDLFRESGLRAPGGRTATPWDPAASGSGWLLCGGGRVPRTRRVPGMGRVGVCRPDGGGQRPSLRGHRRPVKARRRPRCSRVGLSVCPGSYAEPHALSGPLGSSRLPKGRPAEAARRHPGLPEKSIAGGASRRNSNRSWPAAEACAALWRPNSEADSGSENTLSERET